MSKTEDQIQRVMEKFQIPLLHSGSTKYFVHSSRISCWVVPGFRLIMSEGVGVNSVYLSLDGLKDCASASFCFEESGLTAFELALIETFAVGSLEPDIMFLDESSVMSDHYHGNRQAIVLINDTPCSLEDLKTSLRVAIYSDVEYPIQWNYWELDKLMENFDSAARQAYNRIPDEKIEAQQPCPDTPLTFLVSW